MYTSAASDSALSANSDHERGSKLSAIRTRNDTQSPLLRLAAELRNTIYELAVCQYDDILFNAKTRRPPLSQACHRLRVEVTPLFFSGNTFRIIDYSPSKLDGTSLLNSTARFRAFAGPFIDAVSTIQLKQFFRFYVPHTISSAWRWIAVFQVKQSDESGIEMSMAEASPFPESFKGCLCALGWVQEACKSQKSDINLVDLLERYARLRAADAARKATAAKCDVCVGLVVT